MSHDELQDPQVLDVHQEVQQETQQAARGDATARRRRMQKRRAKRQLTRVGAGAFAVFAAAAWLTPEPTITPAPLEITPIARTARNARAATAGPRAEALAVTAPVVWRPAGEVLARKTAPTSLPFGLDPRESEKRESLSRWHLIYTYSSTYHIRPELARKIYDAALHAGIEPELGFRLVRVESEFKTDAVSSAGAIGLTQLMLGTARVFEPGVTRERLLDADVNLRIGFAYLRGLIREYKDLKLALLVYNRGPVAVERSLSMGLDPANGYESVITRGYRGRGILD